ALAWKVWLQQTRGVPHVKVLLDSQAKHAWKRGGKAGGILSDVERMTGKVKKGGRFWFIFIGHGAPGENGDGGLLLGADVEQTVDSFETRGIPVKSELLPRLRKAPESVAILDACFSGLDGRGKRFIKDLQPVLHAQLKSVPGNVTVLTAAKSDQFAGPLPGAARPAFSYLALGALRGWADDDGNGVITAGDVQRFVEDTLMVSLSDRVQVPDLNGNAKLALASKAREPKPVLKRSGFEPELPVRSDTPSGDDVYDEIAQQAKEEEAIERKKQAEKAAREREFNDKLDLEWAKAKPLIQRGGQSGKKALALFLGRWEGKEFPNRYADEANSLFESRQGGDLGKNKAGIAWISIKGGSFQMGSNKGDDDEKPVHTVRVRDFSIGKTEVTVGQYRACVAAGACSEPHWDDETCFVWTGSTWSKGRLPDSFRGEQQPVVCVDWDQAKAFASWAGGRLPSEAEWEYAARSQGQGREYPWGNAQASCSYAVMDDGGLGCGQDRTWPVCSKPRGNTEQGVCDMSGNVWEWVADMYSENYSSTPRDGTEHLSGSERVDRGGGWVSNASGLRAAGRYGFDPGDRRDYLGFRVARSHP
ncbi:formylglycine-generating enzyme family protein, partial [Myxococcota bacterium]|nr:formylglycine-generating enzyme family protein [Myxococcota bacterium]